MTTDPIALIRSSKSIEELKTHLAEIEPQLGKFNGKVVYLAAPGQKPVEFEMIEKATNEMLRIIRDDGMLGFGKTRVLMMLTDMTSNPKLRKIALDELTSKAPPAPPAPMPAVDQKSSEAQSKREGDIKSQDSKDSKS